MTNGDVSVKYSSTVTMVTAKEEVTFKLCQKIYMAKPMIIVEGVVNSVRQDCIPNVHDNIYGKREYDFTHSTGLHSFEIWLWYSS